MQHIVVEGIRPLDGRYELDLSGATFTTLEWGIIKRFSGYYMADYAEGLRRIDAELIVSLAVIALAQAGKIDSDDYAATYQTLASVPFDGASISVDAGEDAEDDADPPPGQPRDKLEREWQYIAARFQDQFGEGTTRTNQYWRPYLGFFGVSPDEVGQLTPIQILGCLDEFKAIHGVEDG